MTAARPGPALREEAALREDAAPCEETEYIFSLPHTPGAVPAVRRRIRAVLADWRLPAEAAEDVLLLASELLANAIVHALPPATLRLSRVWADRRRAVRVEVTDRGPAAPAGLPAPAADPDEHGRGLGIVTALSARCGVREHLGGTGRWADVVVG
ncbi:ATP-binding protein [Streptomyces sp. PR69]|uniref:ATP-binding protein n=1 Tax=Streptomyces sp. PR69 TaxID=2984950 RepID=UPI002263C941|nr:ATP-binding protein [Streptomyces sp. PR69]